MKLGLLGHNVGYSLSKKIMEEKGHEYKVYDTVNFKGDCGLIPEAMMQMLEDKTIGFNVTTPYKQKIIENIETFVDYSDGFNKPKFTSGYELGNDPHFPMQSINCVKFSDDYGIIGTSFDGLALMFSLEHYISNHDDWEDKKIDSIAILGNGGVVPSILDAFKGKISPFNDTDIVVFGRKKKDIHQKLLDEFNAKKFDIIINTIPFSTDFDINFNNNRDFIYYDLNYAVRQLVAKAERNKNCSWSIDGMDMLQRQAEMSLDFWQNY